MALTLSFKVQKKTDIFTIPINEPHWKKEHRLKDNKLESTQMAQSPLDVTPTPIRIQSASSFFVPTGSSTPVASEGSPKLPSPINLLPSTRKHNFPTTADIRSSSPLYDEDRLSVQEFCTQYRLDMKAVQFLEALQFTPGDNLDDVDAEEAREAGFKSLLWKNVLKANKQYRKELRL